MVTRRQLSRREFIRLTTAMAALPLTLPLAQTVNAAEADEGYEAAVANIWRPMNTTITEPVSERIADQLLLKRELVRYATLAASSHNTQCWKFKIAANGIVILPDLSRRCPAVDPDNHHLFVSLGAATENLQQAALANGLQAEVNFDADATQAIEIALMPTKAMASPLFKAIPDRQCTRAEYDGKPLSREELNLLELAGTGDGVHILLHTERQAMENILGYVVAGNSAQMHDAAFMAELKSWIRFSSSDAIRTGDGLYSTTSGNLSVPKWLGSPLFNLLFNEKTENDKYAKQIRSSAGVAIFVSDANDKAHWLEVGRCYERFALQATALGIRSAFLNQAVEVTQVRQQFANHLNIDESAGAGRIDLVVRFGRGKLMPKSLRRPVEAVLV
ncbi:MAG: Tat pathway signal protein [Bdellovibrio sp.]|nr:Tat pathway signal protein [Methylotenera sp.]